MESPQQPGIGPDGLLVRPEVLRRQARESAVNETTMGNGTGEVLDRSLMEKGRQERLQTNLDEVAQRPKQDVLDRVKIAQERKAADNLKAIQLRKTIEQRLSAVEEQVGVKGEEPFSPEGFLNRRFGK